MEVEVLGVMIPIIGIIGIVIMVIYLRRFQNEERLAMINKGMDPGVLIARRTSNPSPVLRASLLLIGAGTGLLLGYILDETTDMEEVAYFSMLLICGGVGLGVAYLVEERKIRRAIAD
jgi:hypothetical protein